MAAIFVLRHLLGWNNITALALNLGELHAW